MAAANGDHLYYVATGRYSETPIGRLLKRSLTVQGIRLEELTESQAHKLNNRYRLPGDLPPRLSMRIAALEVLRLEGGSYLSEDVLALKPPADQLSGARGGLRLFRRSPSGSVSSAIVRSRADDPAITEALQRIETALASSNGLLSARRQTWVVDQALTAVAAECASGSTWDVPVVTEIHPLRTRQLGLPAPSAEPSQSALVILPLDELRQHDETEVFLYAPDAFFHQSDSHLAALMRAGNDLPYSRDRQQAPPHLGGHKNRTNLDIGALTYLIGEFGPATFTDLGCGPGGMVFAAEQAGLRAIGIDGDPTLPELPTLFRHDFATSPMIPAEGTDLCWCVEFLEHVDERFLPHYSPVLGSSKVVMATLAPPEQPGHHHVNCRPVSYWVDVFGRTGLNLDEARTAGVREHSTMRSNFIRDNGYVFTRAAKC